MKKFALVIVCSLIMVILIAFNYLLWDRENKKKDIETLEHSNVSNNASITALGEKINTLETDNVILRDRIKDLEKNITLMQEENKKLKEENAKITELLDRKNELINRLKQKVDVKFLQAPIMQWVEALSKGDYETAYRLQARSIGDNIQELSLSEYIKAYQSSIESIRISTIKLVIDEVPNEKKGDIIFSVELEVTKAQGVDDTGIGLKDGLNKRYITVDYDKHLDSWVITNISPSI